MYKLVCSSTMNGYLDAVNRCELIMRDCHNQVNEKLT